MFAWFLNVLSFVIFPVSTLFYSIFGSNKYKGVQGPPVEKRTSIQPIKFSQVEVPRDPNDPEYCLSFTKDQKEEYKKFFDEYGFVVIRDVLSREQIDATLEEVWNIITGKDPQTAPQVEYIKKYYEEKLKIPFMPVLRDDPRTWTENNGWPPGSHLGLLGSGSAFQRHAFENRVNPVMYDVCKTLMNRNDLWIGIDRYGVIRPNTNVLLPDGTRQDFPNYKTSSTWMHWDINPFKLLHNHDEDIPDKFEKDIKHKDDINNTFFLSERNSTLLPVLKHQGLIALTDARECDGGFLTVPGFSKSNTKAWAEHNATRVAASDDYVMVPRDDPMIEQGRPIPVRAGSLIMWDSRQPHQNFPNRSDRFRICQYVKTFPARDEDLPEYKQFVKARREYLMEKIQPYLDDKNNPLVLDDLGKRLLGFLPWK
jgi:hypothetical protein